MNNSERLNKIIYGQSVRAIQKIEKLSLNKDTNKSFENILNEKIKKFKELI